MGEFIYVEKNVNEVVSELGGFNELSFDLETTGLNPLDSRISLLQLSTPSKTFVMRPSVGLEPLLPFFANPKWRKTVQNAKFDTKFLMYHYGVATNNIFDTMIAEALITTDISPGVTSLRTLAQKYLGITLDKDPQKSFIGMKPMSTFTDKQLEYAALDSEILSKIREIQEAKLEELGLTAVASMEFELAPIVGVMELTGVPIDSDKWNKIVEEYKQQHEASRLKMHEILFDSGLLDEQLGLFARDSINLNSPKQVKEAFIKLGIDIVATNEREISLVNHPAAKELLEYRGLQKILTSYGTSFLDKIHPFTGRIHADFRQLGTATGRFACKEPNLQQMPDAFRQCVSLEDHKIVVADYSQIELRILAELSDDEAFIQAFTTGHDLHTSTASLMFNLPLSDISPDQRFIAKTINFGIAYGMGVNKLADILNSRRGSKSQLTLSQVSAIMKKYRATYRKSTKWLEDAGNLAFRRGYSETILGRRRFFKMPEPGPDFEFQVAHIKRQGANSPIQGTNADITKLAMVDLYKALNSFFPNAKIILQVHDEIGVLAHNREAEAVKKVVEESMIESAQTLIKKVPVAVEAYVRDIWKKG